MDPRLVAYLASLGVTPSALDGWTVHTAQRAGVDCAFVTVRGSEIHFVSLVGPRAMTRRNIAEYLDPIISTHGFATTRVALGETDHRLRHALGFTRTWSDANYSYWMCLEAPYKRNQLEGTDPCL